MSYLEGGILDSEIRFTKSCFFIDRDPTSHELIPTLEKGYVHNRASNAISQTANRSLVHPSLRVALLRGGQVVQESSLVGQV